VKELLLFGAGKIGRSFIGLLFSQAGYEVVFADIDRDLVDRLNAAGAYSVMIRDSNHPENEKICEIRNITAVHLSDVTSIRRHLVKAEVIATSVGKRGLSSLPEMMAGGIRERYRVRKNAPVDIILAENIRDAASLFRAKLVSLLPGIPVDSYVGLVETSIGKMVPIMTEGQLLEDPLAVSAEAYSDLIVDRTGFRNTIPAVTGLVPRDHINAWVDRKIFIHNLGHAVLAYRSFFHDPALRYTWEALEVQQLRDITRRTMLQSARILVSIHPDEFSMGQLEAHIDDLLDRFSNRALGDTIFRVGCDLPRKLNSDDRLMVPVLAGISAGCDISLILEAWVKGCFFRAEDEHGNLHPEDKQFIALYREDPLAILRKHCRLDREDHPLIYRMVEQILKDLK
jgi:mannitol-1-phosphate 5-dehydrogenase